MTPLKYKLDFNNLIKDKKSLCQLGQSYPHYLEKDINLVEDGQQITWWYNNLLCIFIMNIVFNVCRVSL